MTRPISTWTEAESHSSLPLRAGQAVDPGFHALGDIGEVVVGEEVFRVHLVDRIDRAHEIAFVPMGHGRVDAHAAFEIRI